MDVYFYEAFEEEVQLLQEELPPHIEAEYSSKTIQELNHRQPPASVISIRTQSKIPVEWESKLSGILSRSSGYDHLLRYGTHSDKQIRAGYLPLYCNRAVAEQAMLLWMALLRKLSQQMTNFKQFNRDGLTGKECQSKKLLVVGVGHIGSEIVKIGQSLGMEVFGVDLKKRYDFVNYYSLEEVLGKADVIVCAMNLTAENTGYFSYRRLKQTRKGVIFINIARGGMSPSLDLLRLVEEDHLGGLALDVYNQESELAVALRKQSPLSSEEIRANMALCSKENVILTPHNAFNTEESVRRKARQSVQQILHFFKHQTFQWEVGE